MKNEEIENVGLEKTQRYFKMLDDAKCLLYHSVNEKEYESAMLLIQKVSNHIKRLEIPE